MSIFFGIKKYLTKCLNCKAQAERRPMHKARITARRIKILKLIAKSYNNKQIAQFLNLSLSNTKLQKSRLYNYLGVNKAKDAIECGLQIGLINLNDMQDL